MSRKSRFMISKYVKGNVTVCNLNTASVLKGLKVLNTSMCELQVFNTTMSPFFKESNFVT